MKYLLSLTLVFSFLLQGYGQDITDKLFALPDVKFEEIAHNDTETIFLIQILQPVDHNNPDKGKFWQKIYLTHKNFESPMILVTEGYGINRNHKTEIAKILNANQLDVEHRYFGSSLPDSIDYQFLNLEQATADLHHIREIFGKIYNSSWISTGISKGGATTLFYRFLYPDDVNVSIPYVAPINHEFEEKRIYNFLDTVGTQECRTKIFEFQKRLLKNRKTILPWLKFYSFGADYKFNYVNLEKAFELAVLEYPFSFWQWGYNCDTIPTKKTNLEDAVKYFLRASDIGFYSDKDIERLEPHYYQSAAQMGYYGFDISKFGNLIKTLPKDITPMATFFSHNSDIEFNGDILEEICIWLQNSGDHIIYIYGGNDTWSASAVPESDKVDALWFMMKGKNHGSARIKNMTPQEKELFYSTLERWLDIKIENRL